jgi:16S rRNA (cytidine1402-2'-O)-methyltransferase
LSLGNLYLIPVTLGDDELSKALPIAVVETTRHLENFVVENEKTARRFLSAVKTAKPVRELSLRVLDEHTQDKELPALLAPLLAGQDVGLMSEAGCPGVADPGAHLIELAHRKGIRVVPLVGPSSILLALMASGLDGQRFSFLGYLPSEKAARMQRLREIEQHSRKTHETQIFIETPYRNMHLLEDILATCAAETRLCVACNVSLERELIRSQRVVDWKKMPLPDLHKQPTVFLLLG